MQIKTIQNPTWANPEKTAVECFVDFEGIGIVPFAATPDDATDYGPKIFNDCLAGAYGPIADYVAPPMNEPPDEPYLKMPATVLGGEIL